MSTCLTLPLLFLFRPFSEKDIVSCSLCSVCLENQKGFVLLYCLFFLYCSKQENNLYIPGTTVVFLFLNSRALIIQKFFVYIFIHLSMYTFLATLLYNSSESFLPIM